MHQQNLQDQDIAQILLDCHKHAAKCLTTLALESSSANLRNEVINALQTTLNHQQSIWEFMNHQGWYQPSIATQHDLSQAQQAINQLSRFQGTQGYRQGQFADQDFQTQTTYVENPNFY